MPMSPEAVSAIQSWIAVLVRGLLDRADRSSVTVSIEIASPEAATVQITVPDRTMRYVIGKGGSNAEAIRALVKATFRAEGWFRRVDTQIHTGG